MSICVGVCTICGVGGGCVTFCVYNLLPCACASTAVCPCVYNLWGETERECGVEES